jgi:hypothetical protein
LASKTNVDVLDLAVVVFFASSSTSSEAAVLLAEVDARRRTGAGAPLLLGGTVSGRVLLHDDDDDDDAEAPPDLSRAAGRIGVLNAIEDCSSNRNSSSTLPKRAIMIVASGVILVVLVEKK